MRICSSCGETYPDNTNVCGHDGTPLMSAEAVSRIIVSVSEEAPSWQPQAQAESVAKVSGLGATIPRFATIPPHPPTRRIGPVQETVARRAPSPVLKRHHTTPAGPIAIRASTTPEVDQEDVSTDGGAATPVPPAPAPAPAGARVLGRRYRLCDRIAVGGFGEVFAAEDLRLNKRVAVKVLTAQVARNREHLTRFRREAVAASMIGHEGIVNVTDLDCDDDGTSFIVMELLDGRDLAQALAIGGAMEPARALGIAVQIANALAAAHGCGVLHRDLKPANVFLTARDNRQDVVKIVDFGISKVLDERPGNSRVTMNGTVVGTPHYMAPEQAQGRTDLDARVDIYALGVILYEMLVGAPPFGLVDLLAVAQPHVVVKPRPPSARRPGLWDSLDQLVLCALAKDRDARHPSMESFGAALLRELQAIDPLAATLLGAPPGAAAVPPANGTARNPVRVLAGAGQEAFGGVTIDAYPDRLFSALGSEPVNRADGRNPFSLVSWANANANAAAAANGSAGPPSMVANGSGITPYADIQIVDPLEDAETSVRRDWLQKRVPAMPLRAQPMPPPVQERSAWSRAAFFLLVVAFTAATATLLRGDGIASGAGPEAPAHTAPQR